MNRVLDVNVVSINGARVCGSGGMNDSWRGVDSRAPVLSPEQQCAQTRVEGGFEALQAKYVR